MNNKDNWKDYADILKKYKITKLYHFTDRDNLDSIISNGGLFSWKDCEEKQIKITKPGGNINSHSLDERDGLENYVRVSFTNEHPMMYVAMRDGRITNPILLEISTDVILWEGTKYADRNATKNGANIGENIEDLKKIHFESVKSRKQFDLPEEEREFFQAEVLIKNHIPLKEITNIANFGLPIINKPNSLQGKIAYTCQITRDTPTAFIFMVDQSASMSRTINHCGEQIRMSEAVSRIVNSQINELVYRCIKNGEVRRYYDIAIIGYGSEAYSGWSGNLSGRDFVSPEEIKLNPYKRIITREEKRTRAGLQWKEIEKNQWLEPRHDGRSTQMHKAFRKAQYLLEEWLQEHKNKDCYPPTIINITDGEFHGCNNESMIQLSNEIKSMYTNDGNVLMFNIHISDSNASEIVFPADKEELNSNSYARVLYDMSSHLPIRYNNEINKIKGNISSDTRRVAMAVNADMSALIKLLDIGTPTNISSNL